MDTAFPYTQYVTGKNFVGRRADVTLLGNLLSQGEHVCLYEPPKSGKTSLVQQTLYSMRLGGKSFSVGQMSVLNIRTQEEFLLRLGATVLRIVASTPDAYAAIVQQYLSQTHFVFDPAAYAERGEVLSLGWALDQADKEALLDFPFRLAKDHSLKILLIVDEFHCLSLLESPDDILPALDDSLKRNKDNKAFSYIFCGGDVNAMKAIFETSLLFHRRVERVRLSPVDELEMADHVHRGFLTGGKSVDKDLLVGACRLFKGQLWYVNHFAFLCDAMTRGYMMEPVLIEALNGLLAVHEPRFVSIVNSLTTHQVNLLKATIEGATRFSGADVIRRYSLNSSANVKRVKDALMKKEVLLFDAQDTPSFQDPLFEYWLRKYFFEQKD